MAGYQMAMSRNRATEGRASKNPLDIYMQKGQIVARQMPMSRVDFPSDAQRRNVASVVREREIEKQLDLGDVMALRWRANKSRYNWWEILGKIYISREFNNPGSVVGLSKIMIYPGGRYSRISIAVDKYCVTRLMDFGLPEDLDKNHYWRYATHREAGMVEQHRGIEVLRWKWFPLRSICYSGGRRHMYTINNNNFFGHVMMIATTHAYPCIIDDTTGLFYISKTNPWWLDAPFPFMP